MSYNPKGVVLSSGPGDPQKCPDTISAVKKLIDNNILVSAGVVYQPSQVFPLPLV